MRLLPAALLLALALPIGAGADLLRLESARPGNVFEPGEPVAFTVTTDRPTLVWDVVDMVKREVGRGSVAVHDGHAVLTVTPGRLGWFCLMVHAGDERGQALSTNFVVLPPPKPGPPDPRWGVMTHFAQAWPTDITPLIARAGIGQVRDELYWQMVETRPGRYEFNDRYRAYLDALAASRLKLLLVLDFANPLYDDALTPTSDDAVRAFADYAGAMVSRLGDRLSAVEIWNEYNGSFCKGPCQQDKPGSYAKLLKASAAAVRRAAPSLPIAGGASVLAPAPWYRALFDHDAFADVDALVIHPYRPPEGVEGAIGDLRRLIKERGGGRDKTIWATEFGSSQQGPDVRAELARFLVRDATIMLSEGVTRVYWYLMRDYAKFETMGLVAAPESPLGRYAPWPAYAAYATLIRELGALEPWGREPTDPRTRLYRFGTGANELRVAWATDGESRLVFDAATPLDVIDLMGNAERHNPTGGQVTVAIGPDPIYVRGLVGGVRELGREALLADTSPRPGPDSEAPSAWSYGAYLCPEGADPAACLAGYDPDRLEPLTKKDDEWGAAWRSPRYRALFVGADNAHPGAIGGRQVWAVRRWTAPEAGRITLAGEAVRPSRDGDGTHLIILKDGKPVWQADLGGAAPTKANFRIDAEARAGSRFDFALTPGSAADINNDATSFHVTITRKAS